MMHALALSPSAVRGGGASPASLIPGLTMWHDASRADKVALNGGDVTQVDDLSGSARHAAQASGAQQPAYATGGSGIVGKGVVTFTGANNDALNIASALDLARNKPGVTYAGVFRLPALGSAQRILTILAGSSVTLFAALLDTAGRPGATTRRLGADTASSLSSVAAATANVPFFAAWSVDYATGAVIMVMNATSLSQTASWATGVASEDVAHAAAPTLGRNGANILTGDFGEDCFWPFATTAAQLQSLRTNYFKPKWATP